MNLKTKYMGLNLRNPIVPSSSPVSHSLDRIQRVQEAGAGAIVLYSLFEEQIVQEQMQLDHHLSYFTEAFAESLTFFPDMGAYNIGPEEYLNLIQAAKAAVDIPIIGSLNGVTNSGWITYAREIEQAGADALELNIYYIPTTVHTTGPEVEDLYVDILKEVKGDIGIPVAVKLVPFFSAPVNMAARLAEAGADALVLFNRFYQPNLDIDNLDVVPTLTLSTSYDIHLPLRWLAIMYGRVHTDLALTSGVHNYRDVLKGLMAGASVTMLASELLENGIGRITEILDAMRQWMEENEYESVEQMRGSLSQAKVSNPDKFERANYRKVLSSWQPDPTGKDLS